MTAILERRESTSLWARFCECSPIYLPIFYPKMIRALITVSALLGASAFAPSRVSSRASSSLKMGYENELGVQAPAGFFDPLGLSTNIDQETFDYYRAAELKHGRVAQLAVLGYIIPEIYKFPGDIAPGLKFADIPNGVAAISAVPSLGWIQIFFLVGYVDFRVSTGASAWPFTYDAGVRPFPNAAAEAKAKTQELTHGRLAMLAILELLRHDSQNFISGTSFDGLSSKLITGLPFLYGN
jgi:hypothetical protein